MIMNDEASPRDPAHAPTPTHREPVARTRTSVLGRQQEQRAGERSGGHSTLLTRHWRSGREDWSTAAAGRQRPIPTELCMKIKMNRTYIDFSFAYQLRTIIMKTFSGRQLQLTITFSFTTGADIRRNLGPPGHMPIPMAHARFPWPCVFFIALAALAAQCQWVVLIAVISSAAVYADA